MNHKDINTLTKMTTALLDTASGQFDLRFGPEWKVRVNKGSTLMVTITHRFPHPDGRIHSATQQTQLDIDSDTKDFIWMWAIGAVQALVADVIKVK